MKAKNLPRSQPRSLAPYPVAEARRALKAKFLPRDPKDGEVLLLLERPQVGPHQFLEYARGDLIRGGEASYVVEAAKPGYTQGGEGWKRWRQLVVARPATEADHDAVRDQARQLAAERDAIIRRGLDR